MARASTSAQLISFQEFLRLDGEDAHVEWVDGIAVPLPGVTSDENDLMGFLLCIIGHFVEAKDLGQVRYRPFIMRTSRQLPARAPDLFFVSRQRRSKGKRFYFDGPGDLVVEVAHRQTRAVDKEKKFDEYERGGVKEYWLIDPEREHAEFNGLGNGTYTLLPVRNGVFQSTVIKGLWLKVDWLWRRPPLMTVLKEWKLV